ncbi:AcrR family transcriptional regulator [Anaerosolibacter carboniphilus]|uniref:AcrR family transcriptional regulator n=1 Tax=Anaerosolibacter carboniphilus TaxID=1417629 RepID=A0A841KUI8_9FIRM|nr:TetR/AcrR family transcriptional regulator [Anaerosolibacter carboniphilus]MBB6215858.1 AcrR family transcriptional regulator [Anaerosolibacter carboniphilus]
MNKITKTSNISRDNSQKTDLRVRKTKRAIYNALTELLQKKSIDKITVSELSEKAEINKGTFYLHYVDIYDLYQNALNEHLKKIVDKIDFMDLFFTNPDKFSRNLVMRSIKKSIFENDPFFSRDNASFSQSAQFYFCNALATKVLESNQIPATLENEIKLKFIFSGSGSLLRYDSHEDTELIINVISNTIKNLFPEFYQR